jgi:16S rRNA (guanine(966)-N(2))-methyltransferase RsmD
MRPTTDRVKEAIFSILAERVQGAEVIDLCCGAGSLGIEALSRGAAHARFVDVAPTALKAVQTNLDNCGVDAASYRLQRSDAASWLTRFVQQTSQRFVIVLADPPYSFAMYTDLMNILVNSPQSFPLEVAVLEHAGDQEWKPSETSRFQSRFKRYGQTSLTILEA